MKRFFVAGVIFLVLTIGSVFFYFSQGNLTAKVVDGTSLKGSDYCSDSDEGVFSFYNGVVTKSHFLGFKRTYLDSCGEKDKNRDDILTEWYCEDKEVRWQMFRCEYGCDVDRCLKNGGSMQITVKDLTTQQPLANAEVILYSATLDEIRTLKTNAQGKASFTNTLIQFPSTIKKLFREHRLSEPSIFELHTQQYEVSISANGYQTQVESIKFEEGEDAVAQILL